MGSGFLNFLNLNFKRVMDLQAIADVLEQPPSQSSLRQKEMQIIRILASDKNVIPIVLSILNEERNQKKQLTKDMKEVLCITHMYVDQLKEPIANSMDGFTKEYIMRKVKKFFDKYRGIIRHNFRMEGYE